MLKTTVYEEINKNIDRIRTFSLEDLLWLRNSYEAREEVEKQPLIQCHLRIIQLELDARYGRGNEDGTCKINPRTSCIKCGGCED